MHVVTGLEGAPPGQQGRQSDREAHTWSACPRPPARLLKLSFAPLVPFAQRLPSPEPCQTLSMWPHRASGFRAQFLLGFLFALDLCPLQLGPFAEGIPSYFSELSIHLLL